VADRRGIGLDSINRTIVSYILRTIVLLPSIDGGRMRIRWLGWAGVELEAEGERMVIDPLQDAGAVFAWLGDRAGAIPIPDVIPAQPGAIAGVLTHLHRDHADAAALSTVLRTGATVYEPVDYGGESRERLAVVQADHELTAAGLARQPTAAWTSIRAPRAVGRARSGARFLAPLR
jgi:L-ascorbate metabolism protein UlaG (beta-lactamase superfamily)